jgi:TM2 domain-containing membrane protein YozV
MKNKYAASFLSIFLGSFGAHKFYLNKNKVGILYLVFFWTYIPLIIGVIEGIILLTITDDTFNSKYNSSGLEISIDTIVNQNLSPKLEHQKKHILKRNKK